MIRTLDLNDSRNLDMLDDAALSTFAKASELPQSTAALQPKLEHLPCEMVPLTDGQVTAVLADSHFLDTAIKAGLVDAVDKSQLVDASKPGLPLDAQGVETPSVKLPTTLSEFWATTIRPMTFDASVRLLRATVPPVSFVTELLRNVMLSLARFITGIVRPATRPTFDAPEAKVQEARAEQKIEARIERTRLEIADLLKAAELKREKEDE